MNRRALRGRRVGQAPEYRQVDRGTAIKRFFGGYGAVILFALALLLVALMFRTAPRTEPASTGLGPPEAGTVAVTA